MEIPTPLKFRGLETFAHLARVGSFAHASRDLGISQSGLTRQVQRLEEGLGAKLFLRHSKGVTLTDTGLRLLERVEEILQLLAGPIKHALEPGRVRTRLVLGYPPEIGTVLIPRVAQSYISKRPDTIIRYEEDCGASLATRIMRGEVDVGIIYDAPNIDQLDTIRTVEEPVLVVCNPKLDLGRTVHVRQLADLSLILPSTKHSHRRLIQRAAARYGMRLRPAFEVDSLHLRKAFVRQGLGCAILASIAVSDEMSRGMLCAGSIGRTPLTSTLAVLTRKDPALTQDVECLRKVVFSEIQALVETGVWLRARLHRDLCDA